MEEYLSRILYIDLSSKRSWVEDRSELFEDRIGGLGVAVKLYSEICKLNSDPFDPENPLVFTVGPLNGLYPCISKTVAVFKSPVTGTYGESHAGGRLSMAIRMAGYGAIVILGYSDKLLLIDIEDSKVCFREAKSLQGLSSLEVEERLRTHTRVMESIVSIGLAGERLCFYASANVDRYNYFGRLGLGAILGSKNIKALRIRGSGSIKPKDAESYKKLFEKIYRRIVETDAMAKYHYTGTPANIMVLNEIGALPTRNFRESRFEHAEDISGERVGELLLERKVSCPLCPIGCMHIAKLRLEFAKGYEYEPIDIYYNYESMYALGTNLGLKKPEDILKLIYTANFYGFDTMLLGNILAWMTEAYESGLISDSDTNGLKLSWGDIDSYIEAVRRIAYGEGSLYVYAAQGLKQLVDIYGGRDYAMQIAGNGIPGYHTGYASILGFLVASRHSHNSNAGYDIDQQALKRKLSDEELIDRIIEEEDWRNILVSLVACMFARRVYSPDVVVDALRTVGFEYNLDDLMNIGRDIYTDIYRIKSVEGFDPRRTYIPKRLFETPSASGILSEERFRKLLDMYMKRRFKSSSI
ncbi:MAG: aldehyde ferredoxin oxidoreductase C-terminal domain-containing protein [Candidatus Bathyarchaeia archaeon]